MTVARRLAAAGVERPEVEARAMIERLTGSDRLSLLTGAAEVALGPEQEARLDAWLERRAAGEPLQHLLGFASFYGVDLEAGPQALVPRPETERLVELVLQDLARTSAPVVLDVGTGSGAIAVALARERPDAEVWASDVDERALRLAERNVRRCAPDVRLVASDLLDAPALAPLLPRLDALVSNPPYLPDADATHLPAEVRHDPPRALFGGPDGLGPFRRLAAQAAGRLANAVPLWLELDPRTVHAARDEAAAGGWTARVHEDLVGRPRFLEMRRTGS